MKSVWIIGIGVSIFASILLVIWFLSPDKSVLSASDKSQALKTLLGRDPHLTIPITSNNWIVYKNQYLQFAYPSWVKVYTTDNTKAKTGNTLDSFAFADLNTHVSATIQVVSFTRQLPEYPAVNLRLQEKDVYTTTKNENTEVAFSKKQDMVERSSFFLKDGKVTSVAVTGYDDMSVTPLYTHILATLKIY